MLVLLNLQYIGLFIQIVPYLEKVTDFLYCLSFLLASKVKDFVYKLYASPETSVFARLVRMMQLTQPEIF